MRSTSSTRIAAPSGLWIASSSAYVDEVVETIPTPMNSIAISSGAISQCSRRALPSNKVVRSEEHTSELQSLMRISYAVFCLKQHSHHNTNTHRKAKKKQ